MISAKLEMIVPSKANTPNVVRQHSGAPGIMAQMGAMGAMGPMAMRVGMPPQSPTMVRTISLTNEQAGIIIGRRGSAIEEVGTIIQLLLFRYEFLVLSRKPGH